MQRIVSAVANLVPPRLKLWLIGDPGDPSPFANAIHTIFNWLPGERFPVLPCKGVLSGYRMKVDWKKHRSFVYGTWEPDVVKALCQEVSPRMIAFDVGAHGGFYTLLLSKLVGPQGRVFSFEPLAANFQILQKNIVLNHCRNVWIVEKALNECSGTLELTIPDSESELLAGPPLDGNTGGTVTVPAISIDDFLAEANHAVHFIKMDVEGAEGSILKGARKTIELHHPVMMIELHQFDIHQENHPVIADLARWDYKIQYLSKRKYNAYVLAK